MSATTKSDTPYFAENRDETDEAYDAGWNDAIAGGVAACSYQKLSLVKAYYAGFDAAVFDLEANP